MVKQPIIHVNTSIISRCPMSGLMGSVMFTKTEVRKLFDFIKGRVMHGQ